MGTEGRLRPFICVGFAYLLVAIIGPIVVMYATGIDRGEGVLHGEPTAASVGAGAEPPRETGVQAEDEGGAAA